MRRQIRLGPGASDPASVSKLATLSSELAHFTYFGAASAAEEDECNRLGQAAAQRMSDLDHRLAKQVGDGAGESMLAADGSLDELRASLQGDQVLVHYWRYRDRYAAWVITAGDPPKRLELGASATIEQSVVRFLGEIKNDLSMPDRPGSADRGLMKAPDPVAGASASSVPAKRPDRFPVGRHLRELVWDPVVRVLPPGVRRVFIVPDGAIASIPFVALPDEAEADHFLLDRELDFSYLTSPHDLRQPGPVAHGRGVLLVGDVTGGQSAWRQNNRSIKITDSHSGLSNEAAASQHADPATPPRPPCAKSVMHNFIPELPGTRKEVLAIASILSPLGTPWQSDVLLGSAATEEAVRKTISGRRILHFATHAWLGQRRARMPASLFNRDQVDQSAVDAFLVGFDPTIGTGLLLSASDPTSGMRDGILTGLEVATLNLDGVDLVVLSACDTAGTSRGGDGLVGLATTFREAGVASVVASLYPVEDERTVLLMTAFYRYLTQGEDATTSLLKSMRELRTAGYSPFFWAPFVSYEAREAIAKP